jgi:hypothetical protein
MLTGRGRAPRTADATVEAPERRLRERVHGITAHSGGGCAAAAAAALRCMPQDGALQSIMARVGCSGRRLVLRLLLLLLLLLLLTSCTKPECRARKWQRSS